MTLPGLIRALRHDVWFGFRWFDLWVGFYYDRNFHTLYFCPLPCCVIWWRLPPGPVDIQALADKERAATRRELDA